MEPDLEAQRHKDVAVDVENHGSLGSPCLTAKIAQSIDRDVDNVVEGIATPSQASVHRSLATPTNSCVASMTAGTSHLDGQDEGQSESVALFRLAEELGSETPPAEPWFMEMTRLRRLYFVYLNKRLAQCRKRILEKQEASDNDMLEVKELLRDQADAIRDFQYIRSLDILPGGQIGLRRRQCEKTFPRTAHSDSPDVFPFDTADYRCIPRVSKANAAPDPFSNEVREFLRAYLPVKMSWSDADKEDSVDLYAKGYRPRMLSPNGDRFARFIVAMVGALLILVPMYIMALHQNRDKNLITTTVAVVLFTLLYSLALRSSMEQTLAATAGYAAVLTVFVGLTSAGNS